MTLHAKNYQKSAVSLIQNVIQLIQCVTYSKKNKSGSFLDTVL